MAKPKMSWEMTSYGIYKGWNRDTKELPTIEKYSTIIPARLNIEFGYILNIKKAKGKKLYFRIEHPSIPDENGRRMSPFTGELFVRTNDWDFFLGDTIWEPVSNKIGKWRLITTIEGTVLADKTFTVMGDAAGAGAPARS